MSWFLPFGRRDSHVHSPLPTAESQDEALNAAFGAEEADDLAGDDVRIDIGPRGTSSNRSGARTTSPTRPEPPSPAPAYDNAPIAAAGRAQPAAVHSQDASHAANWRDRLSSVVRYGRVATHEAEGEAYNSARAPHQRVGSGTYNDGVFANLVAKPEPPRRQGGLEVVGGDDVAEKEVPPSYDVAAADAAPPYWETTIIAPQGYLGPDNILVDGLPVGNLFGFAWNLLVSMSFQFVGFLLTYLLHTSHAAKNGSRAGLGITLIQWAFYLRQRAAQMQGELDDVDILPPGADVDEQQKHEAAWQALWGADGSSDTPAMALSLAANATNAALDSTATATPTLHGNLPALQQVMRVSSVANSWLSYVLLALGSALIVSALVNYWKAIRFAAAIRRTGSNDTHETVNTAIPRPFLVPF